MDGILTDEQVENWRNILLVMIGPYALLMPREKIQAYRDMMQSRADQLEKDEELERLRKLEETRKWNERRERIRKTPLKVTSDIKKAMKAAKAK